MHSMEKYATLSGTGIIDIAYSVSKGPVSRFLGKYKKKNKGWKKLKELKGFGEVVEGLNPYPCRHCGKIYAYAHLYHACKSMSGTHLPVPREI